MPEAEESRRREEAEERLSVGPNADKQDGQVGLHQ